MKKRFLISLLIILLVVVTGCGTKKEAKTLTCTMKGTVVEGTDIESTYKITYTGDYVDKEERKEVVKSDNNEILSTYQKAVEALYAQYKDIKYYDYKIELNGDTLTSTATINYKKINTNKLLEINSANSMYIKDGKVAIKTLKKVYEDSMGATCE